jgi:acyl-CoA thioester hydrolase
MWSTFDHFNLIQQKREVHSEELLKLFKKVKKPVVEKQFEERIAVFKRQRQ